MDPSPHRPWTEQTLLKAQALAHVGLWEWRRDTGEVRWSPELCRMYGFESDFEHDPERFMRTVLSEDRPLIAAAAVAAMEHGAGFDFELRILGEDGQPRTLHAVGTVEVDPATGQTVRILGTTQDITRRKTAEAALADSERRFRAAFDGAPIGMALVALDGSLLRVNRAAAAIFGRPVAELLTLDFQRLTHPDDLEVDLGLVAGLIAGEADSYVLEKRYVRPGGDVVWSALSVSLVRDPDGRPDYFVSQIQDISEPRRLREHLHHLADHDALTGLLNRRSFDRELARVQLGDAAAVVILDLDHFKQVNDRLGHHAGDAVLRTVADTIRGRLRRADLAARLGGDEFAVLLGDIDLGDAWAIAHALADAIQGAAGHGVGCSVGVAAIQAGVDAEAAMRTADSLMYGRKKLGRNPTAVGGGAAPRF